MKQGRGDKGQPFGYWVQNRGISGIVAKSLSVFGKCWVESNLQRLKRFFAPLASLSFDDRCAEEYGQIRADLSRQGKLIGSNDMLLAAIARAHDAVLVTNNSGEFGRITNLRIVDWQAHPQ